MSFDSVTATDTQGLLAISRRGAELQYVTGHFRDLQGLVWAPFWLMGLTGYCAVALGAPKGYAGLAVLAGSGLWAAFWVLWMAGWYGRKYGRVTEDAFASSFPRLKAFIPDNVPESATGLYLLLVLLMVVLSWWVIFGNSPQDFTAGGLVGFFWIQMLPRCMYETPANAGVWVKLRQKLYIGAAVLSWGLLIECLWKRQGGLAANIAYFAAMLLLCLYDHWLLGHLLQPRKEAA